MVSLDMKEDGPSVAEAFSVALASLVSVADARERRCGNSFAFVTRSGAAQGAIVCCMELLVRVSVASPQGDSSVCLFGEYADGIARNASFEYP